MRMLLALAAMLAAAPARADEILAAALEGRSVTRGRSRSAADEERRALAQLNADLNDATVTRNVLMAFLYLGDAGVMADRYADRGKDLQQRAVALSAELARAEGNASPEGLLAVAAARRRAEALRLDVLAWTLLPAAVHEIDERVRMDFAPHRPAFVAAIRRIAAEGDYQGARQTVLDSLN